MLQDAISLLGIANPQLSLVWQDQGTLSEETASPMAIKGSDANEWLAPASGIFNKKLADRLVMPDGAKVPETSHVLAVHPQVFLRLSRLYGAVIEGRTTGTDRPQRPVPKYFAFHGTENMTAEGPKAGNRAVGDRLEIKGGRVTVHDQAGHPIDALSAASAILALMSNLPALMAKDFGAITAPQIANSKLGQLVSGLTTQETRVRIVTMFGEPVTNAADKFTNLDVLNAGLGLYTVKVAGQPILRVFQPTNLDEHYVVGPASFGTLDESFTIRALSSFTPLSIIGRDFLTLYGEDVNAHIIGREPRTAPFDKNDFKLPTFHNENIELLTNGNRVFARHGQIIANSDGLSLVVSPVIADNFAVAASPEQSEWPAFPPGGDGAIAGRLENLNASAHFLAAPEDVRDVFLRLEVPEKEPGKPQLAPGTAVRIFNRKFLADAREGRGNGSGGTLDTARTIGFLVKNPFSLRKDETIPTAPVLNFDLVAVNRSGKKRSFGLITSVVDDAAPLDPAEAALAGRGNNQFNTATDRGVSPAGLLGLPAPPLNTLGGINSPEDAINVALSFCDESQQPRVAPRLPLMTRNETIVAGRDSAGNWSAALSGLWVRGDSRSSFHRLASPGSPGGEEFSGAGLSTTGGRLAYDLARAAYRRARGLATRLEAVSGDARWLRPVIGAPNGTFSAAILQDIAPGSDSPNLEHIPEAAFVSLPLDWPGLVSGINNILPGSLAANAQLRNTLNSLASSVQGVELYTEFRYDAVTARFGRRDSYAPLRSAIKEARELIYIETPSLSFTDYLPNDPDPNNTENKLDPPNKPTDLISLIAEQMTAKPGLKVVIGVSKEFFAGPGYEGFAARNYVRRKRALDALKAAGPERVTLFHPIGFPGRPLRLMHNVVIVDDLWLLLGSGSMTRRGLTFDGNLSVVCFDREIEFGRSRRIRDFRRALMATHLGADPVPGAAPGDFIHPSRTRTADLHESFFAMRDLVDQGGAGLVEAIWDGTVSGQTPIPPDSFPHRDLADPDGSSNPTVLGALLQLFAGLGDADA